MASSFTNPMKKHDVTIWKVIKSINVTSLESLSSGQLIKREKMYNQWSEQYKKEKRKKKNYEIYPINHVLCVPQPFSKQLLYEHRIWIKKGSSLHQQFKALRLCNWSCHSIEEYTRYLEKRVPHWCFSFLIIFTELNIRKYI